MRKKAPNVRLQIAFTPDQLKVLDRLSRKLLLRRSAVTRLALARLAEAEGVIGKVVLP